MLLQFLLVTNRCPESFPNVPFILLCFMEQIRLFANFFGFSHLYRMSTDTVSPVSVRKQCFFFKFHIFACKPIHAHLSNPYMHTKPLLQASMRCTYSQEPLHIHTMSHKIHRNTFVSLYYLCEDTPRHIAYLIPYWAQGFCPQMDNLSQSNWSLV